MLRPRHLAVAALVALLAACGGDGDETPEPAATSDAPTAEATTPPAPAPTTAAPATPSDEPMPTATESGVVITLTVSDGEVSGAEGRVEVPLGVQVTLRVTADVDDEIHVHGYDLHEDVTAGQEATLTFVADIPGVFEVELEESGTVLVRLEVQ